MFSLRLSRLLIGAAVLAALFAGLDGLDPEPVKAGRGFGAYTRCRKACYTKRCRGSCARAKRTCAYCVKQDAKPLKAACKGQGRACRTAATAQIKVALQTCKGATGQCRGCCRDDYGAACTQSFAGTSGFGTYFRKSSYGNKRYKPVCDGQAGGEPGTGCVAACERARTVALRTCGRKRCDTTAIEAQYAACLAGCGVTTTTTITDSTTLTSTTSVTSTTLSTCPNPTYEDISGHWQGSFSGGHSGTWDGVVTQAGTSIFWTTTITFADLRVCSNAPGTFCTSPAQCIGGTCDPQIVSGVASGTNHCGALFWDAPGVASYTGSLFGAGDCLTATWQGYDNTSGVVTGCRVAGSPSGTFIDAD
jgi:hypothetical protein